MLCPNTRTRTPEKRTGSKWKRSIDAFTSLNRRNTRGLISSLVFVPNAEPCVEDLFSGINLPHRAFALCGNRFVCAGDVYSKTLHSTAPDSRLSAVALQLVIDSRDPIESDSFGFTCVTTVYHPYLQYIAHRPTDWKGMGISGSIPEFDRNRSCIFSCGKARKRMPLPRRSMGLHTFAAFGESQNTVNSFTVF